MKLEAFTEAWKQYLERILALYRERGSLVQALEHGGPHVTVVEQTAYLNALRQLEFHTAQQFSLAADQYLNQLYRLLNEPVEKKGGE